MNRLLPRFYPIVDTGLLAGLGFDPLRFSGLLLEEGARILQVRHKGALTRGAFQLMERIRSLCAEAGAMCIINDRADVAALLDAGLHLGQEDLPPAMARRVAPAAFTGLSTHNKAQAGSGSREPVDYLAIGPVFATGSKQNPDPLVGLEGVGRVRDMVSMPLVAIGGITLERTLAVLEAGADSVAVIGDLTAGGTSEEIIRERIRLWLQATK
jgi:thiamine-phosphate pyrophosphorylase